MNEPKLTIELVPESSWFANVRSNVSKEVWDILRRRVYRKANYRCEICGGKGEQWPVECHEIWYYDDDKNIQRLNGLIALCPNCHEVKHIGLAGARGRSRAAVKHLARVNGWAELEAAKYAMLAFEVWAERSGKEWTLDLSWLEGQKL